MELKSTLLRTLFEWASVNYSHYFPSFEEFLDFCTFCSIFAFPSTLPVYWGSVLLINFLSLLIKKQIIVKFKKLMGRLGGGVY